MKRIGILTSGGDCQGLNSISVQSQKHFIRIAAMTACRLSALLTATEDLFTTKQG